MSWRGSTTFPDRIFACLPYLLPLIEVFAFRYAGIIIFFALWLLVVRNEKISHFIRFNTMQAIILDIVIFLCSILTDIVKLVPGSGFAMQTLYTTIFMGIVAAVVYSVAQSLMGKYAEIPAISDAVYMQVR